LFVDRLTSVKPLSAAERRAISTFLEGAVDLDDVVQRTVRMLAQLTRQVAIVQYPSLTRSTVRHVELVNLAPGRLLLVLITSTGRVEQRVIEVSPALDDAVVADLRARLNALAIGQRLADAAFNVETLADAFDTTDQPSVSKIVATLVGAFSDERSDERIVIGGTANLARFGESFETAIRPVLEALEEHVVLLKLLGEATSPSAMTVRIGHELPFEELSATSVVATGYGPGDEALANLGIVGPTRMDYPSTIAAVRAVAGYVSQTLGDS
jgi:heat-inducible transcriptional repressor